MTPKKQVTSTEPGSIDIDSVPVQPVQPTDATTPDPIALKKIAHKSGEADVSRAKAAAFMSDRKFDDAKKALEEADTLEADALRLAQAEAARASASQFLSEGRYAEAKKALEEADLIEAGPEPQSAPQRMLTDIRSRLQNIKFSKSSGETEKPASTDTTDVPEAAAGAVDQSLSIVRLYSMIAAGVGLLPGGLLNFGAILIVQIAMVWRIANIFGHKDGKERIRGSILSLIGSAIPTVVGHSAGFAIATIPAVIAGTAVYFIVTPVLAYAMTQAVGKAFIMHFESGGTLLSFDPRAFGEYFLKEFQSAGGTLKKDLKVAPPVPASATAGTVSATA